MGHITMHICIIASHSNEPIITPSNKSLVYSIKVKQSLYRSGQVLSVPGS